MSRRSKGFGAGLAVYFAIAAFWSDEVCAAQAWSALPGGPSHRHRHGLVDDSGRQRVVLFGGTDLGPSQIQLDDTWEWDGTVWIQRQPTLSPPPREAASMAYDAARQRVLLFGGQQLSSSSPIVLGDTWEWDGSTWTQRLPANAPAARAGASMAYDVARQRVVLFGGESGGLGTYFADTWEWDGTNWTLHNPPTSPGARADASAAYDSLRNRIVVAGGQNRRVFSYETWEWDGATWTSHPPLPPFPPQTNSMPPYIAFNEDRQRMVTCLYDARVILETWERVGINWVRATTDTRPNWTAPLAYDAARRRVVLFFDRTWIYQSLAGTSSAFGLGCRTGAAPPLLWSSAPNTGGNLQLRLALAPPHALCAFGWSSATQSTIVGPCNLYLQDPMLWLPAVTDAGGVASTTQFAIPWTTGGSTSHAQAFVADPSGPYQGLIFTAGLRLVVGY